MFWSFDPFWIFWMIRDLTNVCYKFEFGVTFCTFLGLGCDPDKVQEDGIDRYKPFTILEIIDGSGDLGLTKPCKMSSS